MSPRDDSPLIKSRVFKVKKKTYENKVRIPQSRAGNIVRTSQARSDSGWLGKKDQSLTSDLKVPKDFDRDLLNLYSNSNGYVVVFLVLIII